MKRNTPPLSCCGQITLLKVDVFCPFEIPNQISTISMHMPSLVKIHCYLLRLSSVNENTNVWQADNCQKIDEICPLAIPDQISTISMHTPSFVKLGLMFTQVIIGYEIWTDGRTTDGRTDG